MPGAALAAIHASPATWASRPATARERSPILSASAPARGASGNGAIPQGSRRSPAPSGCWPRVTCWNCGMTNTAPVSEALRKKIAASPAANAGLRKSFGGKAVLDGIDLEVGAGTTFSLLGPNRVGKTTTVQIMSTLVRADAGEVRVAGHDVA